MINYGFVKLLDRPFEQVEKLLVEKLATEGFGILTRIDVTAKFKEKLGSDFRKYVILGACNPASAHKAILAEENIGLMLPCNVILYEKDGKTAVAIIRPEAAMGMIDNPQLHELAQSVEAKLKRVFEALV